MIALLLQIALGGLTQYYYLKMERQRIHHVRLRAVTSGDIRFHSFAKLNYNIDYYNNHFFDTNRVFLFE
jgi:hypothetical protein